MDRRIDIQHPFQFLWKWIPRGVRIPGTLLLITLGGCGQEASPLQAQSAPDVKEHERIRGKYRLPDDAQLEEYVVTEAWVEASPSDSELRLVLHLRGPHVDREPRVHLEGVEGCAYRGIRSRGKDALFETWEIPDPPPRTVTLTRGGKQIRLTLAGQDKGPRDASDLTYRLVRSVPSHERFAFSRDGSAILYYTPEKTFEIRNLETWEALASFKTEGDHDPTAKSWVRPMPGFGPKGALVAQLEADSLSFFDPSDWGKVRKEVVSPSYGKTHPERGSQLLVLGDSTLLFSGRPSYVVFRKQETWKAYSLAFSGPVLRSDSLPEIIGLTHDALKLTRFDRKTWKALKPTVLREGATYIQAPRGTPFFCLATELSSSVRLHDPRTLKEIRRWDIPGVPILGIAVSPDGAWLAACGVDGKVAIARASETKTLTTFGVEETPGPRVHGQRAPYLALSEDGRFLGVHLGFDMIRIFQRR